MELALALLVVALLAWLLARLARRRTGLPTGQVIYADTRGWARPEKSLFSKDWMLAGKPDYLVRQKGQVVPVEVKSMAAPAGGAHPAHIYQLAAYCALVSEAYGRRPRQGLIKYANKTLAVDYTPALEAELRRLLQDLRKDAQATDVPRSHSSPARCRACGFRDVCDQSLA